jgi:hypothetical protein
MISDGVYFSNISLSESSFISSFFELSGFSGVLGVSGVSFLFSHSLYSA